MSQLLAQGKVKAAWLPEPFGTEAQQEYGAVQALNEARQLGDTGRQVVETVAGCPIFL